MIEKEKNDKNKLLIYAHYYVPDVASTAQILKELAEGMLHEFEITVVCVVPSYSGKIPGNYKSKLFYKEKINGVNIIRVRVPEFSKGRKISRIKNIIAYFLGAIIATFKVGKVDYVYAISQPPILGGLLGVLGKWIKRAKYIYNIQDFNPEQTMAIGYSQNALILNTMMAIDKVSCKLADKVILVGRDMIETLKERFDGERIPNHVFINNWTNEKEIYPLPKDDTKIVAFKKRFGLENKYIIMYSGNIGLYYDLEKLMHIIKKFPIGTKTADNRDVVFVFVGDGSIKEKLQIYKEENHLDNVIFIPYQEKADLIYSLNSCDLQWCISAAGIKGVSVPSKLYGIMAAGKPVLGVLESGSEARLIIEETGCGLVCDPGNYKAVEDNINNFLRMDAAESEKMGASGRDYLVENLTKDVSIEKYINEIISC